LRLPPLRDRKDDIPLIIAHYLQRYGSDYVCAPETLAALTEYDWPGNVRELENCIQHMIAVNPGPLLRLDDLPSTVMNRMAPSPVWQLAAAVGSPVEIDTSPIVPLEELERREILRAVHVTKGDRTAAASLLGIGRTTLYRKLKSYGVVDS
jgi:DNA-binding NtrC family response regulator